MADVQSAQQAVQEAQRQNEKVRAGIDKAQQAIQSRNFMQGESNALRVIQQKQAIQNQINVSSEALKAREAKVAEAQGQIDTYNQSVAAQQQTQEDIRVAQAAFEKGNVFALSNASQRNYYRMLVDNKNESINEIKTNLQNQGADQATIDKVANELKQNLGRISTAEVKTNVNNILKTSALEKQQVEVPKIEEQKLDTISVPTSQVLAAGQTPPSIGKPSPPLSLSEQWKQATEGKNPVTSTITFLAGKGFEQLGKVENIFLSKKQTGTTGVEYTTIPGQQIIKPEAKQQVSETVLATAYTVPVLGQGLGIGTGVGYFAPGGVQEIKEASYGLQSQYNIPIKYSQPVLQLGLPALFIVPESASIIKQSGIVKSQLAEGAISGSKDLSKQSITYLAELKDNTLSIAASSKPSPESQSATTFIGQYKVGRDNLGNPVILGKDITRQPSQENTLFTLKTTAAKSEPIIGKVSEVNIAPKQSLREIQADYTMTGIQRVPIADTGRFNYVEGNVGSSISKTQSLPTNELLYSTKNLGKIDWIGNKPGELSPAGIVSKKSVPPEITKSEDLIFGGRTFKDIRKDYFATGKGLIERAPYKLKQGAVVTVPGENSIKYDKTTMINIAKEIPNPGEFFGTNVMPEGQYFKVLSGKPTLVLKASKSAPYGFRIFDKMSIRTKPEIVGYVRVTKAVNQVDKSSIIFIGKNRPKTIQISKELTAQDVASLIPSGEIKKALEKQTAKTITTQEVKPIESQFNLRSAKSQTNIQKAQLKEEQIYKAPSIIKQSQEQSQEASQKQRQNTPQISLTTNIQTTHQQLSEKQREMLVDLQISKQQQSQLQTPKVTTSTKQSYQQERQTNKRIFGFGLPTADKGNKVNLSKIVRAFKVFSRRKGKEILVAKDLPQNRALLAGKTYAESTLARSIRLEESGTTKLEDISPVSLKGFRPSKRDSGRMVQINALSSRTEVRDILAAKRSKSKKGWFR